VTVSTGTKRIDLNREDWSGMDDSSAPARPSGSDPGDVVVLAQTDHTLVMLYGDIDLRCADDLEHAGRFAIDASRRTIMDVRHVTMLDSVGISFVIRLAAGLRIAGTQLILRGPNPRVVELLTLLGADDLVSWTMTVVQGGPGPPQAEDA
jgi:anti-anti-sigma factor